MLSSSPKTNVLFLEKSLPILLEQAFSGDFEIIVVDSGSTDGALELIRRQAVRLVQIPAERFGYAYAYNNGMQFAQGEFLVRLSGDAVPMHQDWLTSLLKPFDSDPLLAAVWSRQVSPPGLRNPMESLINLLYYSPLRKARRYRHAVSVMGGNMALRRSFLAVASLRRNPATGGGFRMGTGLVPNGTPHRLYTRCTGLARSR